MREASIIAVVAINFFVLVRYCWLIGKERIRPALAMWVFFSIAVCGSIVTYLSVGDYSLLDNILNTSDLVFVVTVSVFIFIFGDRSSRFNRFDLGCLIAFLENSYKSGKISEQEYKKSLEELGKRHEEMWSRLDGTYQIPHS